MKESEELKEARRLLDFVAEATYTQSYAIEKAKANALVSIAVSLEKLAMVHYQGGK